MTDVFSNYLLRVGPTHCKPPWAFLAALAPDVWSGSSTKERVMTYYEIASDAYGRIDLRTGQLEHRARASSAIGVLRSTCRRPAVLRNSGTCAQRNKGTLLTAKSSKRMAPLKTIAGDVI
jgi:hypothetical protein